MPMQTQQIEYYI